MAAPYMGRCNCGAVTASITAEPIQTPQCWCLQCQKTAAGGPTHNVIFPSDAVSSDGALGTWAYVAPSGNTLTQSYCLACGTPVLAQSSARPQMMTFRLGFLDDGHGLRPQIAIGTDEAPEWAVIDPALEQFSGQPPAPKTD